MFDYHAFIKVVRRIAEESRSGADDWPQIRAALKKAIKAGIREEDALALLIGLRATERQKDDRARAENIAYARSYVNFRKGYAAKAEARARLRKLSIRSFDRIQTRLVYGFLLKRKAQTGRRWVVSSADFRALEDALVMVLVVLGGHDRSDAETLYQNFRQRIGRFTRKPNGNPATSPAILFGRVYATVFGKS